MATEEPSLEIPNSSSHFQLFQGQSEQKQTKDQKLATSGMLRNANIESNRNDVNFDQQQQQRLQAQLNALLLLRQQQVAAAGSGQRPVHGATGGYFDSYLEADGDNMVRQYDDMPLKSYRASKSSLPSSAASIISPSYPEQRGKSKQQVAAASVLVAPDAHEPHKYNNNNNIYTKRNNINLRRLLVTRSADLLASDGSSSSNTNATHELASFNESSGSTTTETQAKVASTSETAAKFDAASSNNGNQVNSDGNLTTTAATKLNSSDYGVDKRLANFINVHLLPRSLLTTNSSIEEQALAREFAKVYKVMKFASKLADKLATGSYDRQQPTSGRQLNSLARSSSSSPSTSTENNAKSNSLLAGAASGGELIESLRRHGSRLVVGRLAKKTDWNALFVKLAKVFLQYFLDLILNDMFGTTGKLCCLSPTVHLTLSG